MIPQLLRTVETMLKAVFSDTKDLRVRCTPPGGRPFASAGQWFVAVWCSSETSQDRRPETLDEVFEVKVTITHKLAYAPNDRQADEMIDGGSTIYDKAEAVKVLHGSIDVMTGTNAALVLANKGNPVNGMIEPLVYIGTQYQERGDDWILASGGGNPPNVYTAEVSFTHGRRVRRI